MLGRCWFVVCAQSFVMCLQTVAVCLFLDAFAYKTCSHGIKCCFTGMEMCVSGSSNVSLSVAAERRQRNMVPFYQVNGNIKADHF